MKALGLGDVQEPAVADDDVLVRVRAASVDHGVWHLMTGLPDLVRAIGHGWRTPKVPVRSRDVTGLVEAAGKKATRSRPGNEVVGISEGSFAEYALLETASWHRSRQTPPSNRRRSPSRA